MPNIFEGIGNMFNSFFHPERGYEEAEKEFRRAWEEAKRTQQPFVQQGQAQYGPLVGAEQALLDPETLLKKWMTGYEMSPYAQKSLENARSGGLNAASSMGLLGSSAALGNIEQSASDIMNKDRQSYLEDLMNKYLQGAGIAQNLYGIGANMAGALGQQGLNVGQNIAGARFGEQNAPGNLLENLIRLGTNIFTRPSNNMQLPGTSSISGNASRSSIAA